MAITAQLLHTDRTEGARGEDVAKGGHRRGNGGASAVRGFRRGNDGALAACLGPL